MAKRLDALIDRFLHRRSRRGWATLANSAAELNLPDLKHYRKMAQHLNQPLSRFLHEADHRLSQPIIGSNAIETPVGTDWCWRPEIWRGPVSPCGQAAVPSKTALSETITVYHDCPLSELTCRQIRNISEFDLAPFGLRMDVFHFDGSFLSLSVGIPEDMIASLSKRHILRLDTIVETEKPLEIFARLNLRHGPNVEQQVREIPLFERDQSVEFDLAYMGINESRISKVWVDIIFEGPQLNQIILRDVTFSRRPRANL